MHLIQRPIGQIGTLYNDELLKYMVQAGERFAVLAEGRELSDKVIS